MGLAQNFGALRALAVEGIQTGHMKLHAKAMAQLEGVPESSLQAAIDYMSMVKRYDRETIKRFMQINLLPRGKL